MEIVVRAVIVFFFLWGITRVVGRSTLGELSSFELILFVVMGDLIQQGVTQQDYSVTGAFLAVGTFALLTILLSWINARMPKARKFTQGTPVVVVKDGECDMKTISNERLSLDELLGAARQQGIERIGDIRLCVLETNGELSFFTSEGAEEGATQAPEVG